VLRIKFSGGSQFSSPNSPPSPSAKTQWQKPKYAVKHFRAVLLIQGKLHTVMTVNGDIFEVKLPPKKQYAMKELRVIAYDFEGRSSLW
jgi:hypothetical protein